MNLPILMTARCFAVVGASADPDKVGHQILSNLLANENLTVYPINLKGGTILGLPVYPHLWETPSVPDVVIIAVPAPHVESVIDECVKIKCGAVVLITSGFAETGRDGAMIQKRIEDKLSSADIALLGPNSMGYIVPPKQIYATFGPNNIGSGGVAVISQSGAMLSALFEEYTSSGVGVSFALSLGNRTGYSENDALQYAQDDPNTRVIVVYLESLADPKQLLKLAKQLSLKKPTFLLKGGVTQEGRSAAVSHTAALATSQVLLDHLCFQSGIVQVENFEQLVRVSIAAAKTTFLPENILIVTNAGGPAVVMTDEIVHAGIPLAKISDNLAEALKSHLPSLKISNPLDLLGDASAADYQVALATLSQQLDIDAIVVLVTEQAVTDLPAITKVLSRKWGKHLLFACLAGGDDLDIYRQTLKNAGVITTRYPNEIAETIGFLLRAKKRLGIKSGSSSLSLTQENAYPQNFAELTFLLTKYHLPSPKEIIIDNEAHMPKIAQLGWPLIAKTTDLKLLHKGKLGAVVSDITTLAQARDAFDHLQTWGKEVVFEEKVKEGIEVLLGAHHDSLWGWYLAVGIGGSLSNTYDDRAYVFLPGTERELDDALNRTKLVTLLDSSARNELLTAMYNLQACIFATRGLSELEINPLFVGGHSVIAADLKRA